MYIIMLEDMAVVGLCLETRKQAGSGGRAVGLSIGSFGRFLFYIIYMDLASSLQ